MKRNIQYFLVVILVLLAIKGVSQDTLTSENVEQKSYQLYLDKNWPELIKVSNKAIKNGYDYFYLQLRVGIAYYEQKNYSIAEGHFQKALSFNADDELSLEYLYYCYLFVGRNEEARWLSKKFSATLAEKIGTDRQSKIGFILIEAGSKITDSISYYNKGNQGLRNYYKSPIYFQLGLNHYVKNKASVFHALTYFNQESFTGKISQFQYFLKTAIPLKKNWLISPTIHWVNSKSTVQSLGTATMIVGPPPPPGHQPQINTTSVLTNNSTSSNYFIGSFSVQKIVKKLTFGLGISVSNINKVSQYNNNGFISYSFLGNSKLILGCGGYFHSEDNYSSSNFAIAPFIYTQPKNWLALKISYFNNTKKNIVEENGYLVNNSADLTTSRYSVLVNFTINKHLSLYGLYQLENKYEEIQKFNYRYNVILGGIKITP